MPLFNLGGGITCAGTSLSCRISTDNIINTISERENYYKKKQNEFIPKQIPEFTNFKLYLHGTKLNICQQPGNKIIQYITLNFSF